MQMEQTTVPKPPRVYLREWREWRALSQAELAASAGLTIATISKLENQHYGAQPGTRRKLAQALNIEPHQLLSPPGYAAADDQNRG
jgi:transcriptional regulator with XRE-family HTH domain